MAGRRTTTGGLLWTLIWTGWVGVFAGLYAGVSAAMLYDGLCCEGRRAGAWMLIMAMGGWLAALVWGPVYSLTIGLLFHVALSKLGLTRFWHYAAAGTLSGLVVTALSAASMSIDVHAAIEFALPFAASGLAAQSLFWFVRLNSQERVVESQPPNVTSA